MSPTNPQSVEPVPTLGPEVMPAMTEFSITELEDRLEFVEVCDDNCKCTVPKDQL